MTSTQARTPDRTTGLPPGVIVGPLGRRFVAHLIDGIVPTVISLVAFGLPGGDASSTAATTVGVVLIAVWALVVWWMFATRAAGPGMRLLKLQLVGFTDGRPIGWGRFLLRAVVLNLLSATGLGLLLMLVFLLRHPRHQGWHDLAAGSVVIRARALAPRTAQPPNRPAAAQVRPAASPAPSTADAAPVQPVPVEPAPVQPAPVQPAYVQPAPVQPAPVQPAPVQPARIQRPRVEPAPVEPVTVAVGAPTWVAELEDGRELAVTGLVLLGRNPQPRPGEEGAELIKLSDESRTVSKSHLALDVDEHGLFVVDRDSTNGSTFTTAAGEAFRCVPGQVTYVGEGSVISIGDHRLTVRLAADETNGEQRRPR
ncbi:RDD family protein [uncultured Friedmanniella sp.]|uniref:RDD family protein n=1 Tax=uncultured Friedmanniella sp. TaxID=335381 RepID=UPI0035C9E6EE